MRQKLFSLHCFTYFPKATAPQHVVFSGKLSTVIIFKLCTFSVNLWTLCFLSYKSYIPPLREYLQINCEAGNPVSAPGVGGTLIEVAFQPCENCMFLITN